jgi:hypothetical protein
MKRCAVGRDLINQVFHCFLSLSTFRDEGREKGDRCRAGGSSRNKSVIKISDVHSIVKMVGDIAA